MCQILLRTRSANALSIRSKCSSAALIAARNVCCQTWGAHGISVDRQLMVRIFCSVHGATFATTSSKCNVHFMNVTWCIVHMQHRCESIYFLCECDGIHGIYCCTACGEYFKKAAKRANISGTNWRIWNKKDYRVFKRSDWTISYTRSLSLLQWVAENRPTRAPNKQKNKKRKSKSPLPHPRDGKKPSKKEVLQKLAELTALVKEFVNEWWWSPCMCFNYIACYFDRH